MPGATYVNTIQASASVTGTAVTGGGGGTVTMYTVPADNFVIFQWTVTSIVATNYVRLAIDGNLVHNATVNFEHRDGIYAGPGAVIAHQGDGAGASAMTGVLFANSV